MSESGAEPLSGRPGRRLVVTADDFGLSMGICRGIADAHLEGIVTATSALVVAPGFADGSGLLDDLPDLEVGVHLALVGEDPPLSPAREIPTLVDRRGQFLTSWRHLLPRLAAGRVDPDEVRLELSAQVARARAAGITPTHLDTHQHLHLWPSVGRVVVELARAEDIAVVRSPRAVARGAGLGFDALGRRTAVRIDRAGLVRTDAFVGWEESGRHGESALLTSLDRIGRGAASTTELVLHPGRSDAAARRAYPWGYQWEAEVAAACSRRVRAAVDVSGLALIGPSALTRTSRS